MRRVRYYGEVYEFPDGTSDSEVSARLNARSSGGPDRAAVLDYAEARGPMRPDEIEAARQERAAERNAGERAALRQMRRNSSPLGAIGGPASDIVNDPDVNASFRGGASRAIEGVFGPQVANRLTGHASVYHPDRNSPPDRPREPVRLRQPPLFDLTQAFGDIAMGGSAETRQAEADAYRNAPRAIGEIGRSMTYGPFVDHEPAMQRLDRERALERERGYDRGLRGQYADEAADTGVNASINALGIAELPALARGLAREAPRGAILRARPAEEIGPEAFAGFGERSPYADIAGAIPPGIPRERGAPRLTDARGRPKVLELSDEQWSAMVDHYGGPEQARRNYESLGYRGRRLENGDVERWDETANWPQEPNTNPRAAFEHGLQSRARDADEYWSGVIARNQRQLPPPESPPAGDLNTEPPLPALRGRFEGDLQEHDSNRRAFNEHSGGAGRILGRPNMTEEQLRGIEAEALGLHEPMRSRMLDTVGRIRAATPKRRNRFGVEVDEPGTDIVPRAADPLEPELDLMEEQAASLPNDDRIRSELAIDQVRGAIRRSSGAQDRSARTVRIPPAIEAPQTNRPSFLEREAQPPRIAGPSPLVGEGGNFPLFSVPGAIGGGAAGLLSAPQDAEASDGSEAPGLAVAGTLIGAALGSMAGTRFKSGRPPLGDTSIPISVNGEALRLRVIRAPDINQISRVMRNPDRPQEIGIALDHNGKTFAYDASAATPEALGLDAGRIVTVRSLNDLNAAFAQLETMRSTLPRRAAGAPVRWKFDPHQVRETIRNLVETKGEAFRPEDLAARFDGMAIETARRELNNAGVKWTRQQTGPVPRYSPEEVDAAIAGIRAQAGEAGVTPQALMEKLPDLNYGSARHVLVQRGVQWQTRPYRRGYEPRADHEEIGRAIDMGATGARLARDFNISETYAYRLIRERRDAPPRPPASSQPPAQAGPETPPAPILSPEQQMQQRAQEIAQRTGLSIQAVMRQLIRKDTPYGVMIGVPLAGGGYFWMSEDGRTEIEEPAPRQSGAIGR